MTGRRVDLWCAIARGRHFGAAGPRRRPARARAPRRRVCGRRAHSLIAEGWRAMYRIGIDVGGTFTDLVAVDDGGATTLAKVPSTPQDPSVGVLDGLTQLAERLGLERAALLAQTDRIVHGTTVATNALLERKGARLGLLTTEGHRDVIEMREGLKDERYNLRMPPPEQLVPRRLRLGGTRAHAGRRPDRGRARPGIARPRSPCCSRNRSRRSRSATCTPGAIRATRTRRARHCSAHCPASMSRCRPRCCRRSRSSSGSRRRSSTPMSGRCCRATWRGSTRGSPKPATRVRP